MMIAAGRRRGCRFLHLGLPDGGRAAGSPVDADRVSSHAAWSALAAPRHAVRRSAAGPGRPARGSAKSSGG